MTWVCLQYTPIGTRDHKWFSLVVSFYHRVLGRHGFVCQCYFSENPWFHHVSPSNHPSFQFLSQLGCFMVHFLCWSLALQLFTGVLCRTGTFGWSCEASRPCFRCNTCNWTIDIFDSQGTKTFGGLHCGDLCIDLFI